MSVFHDSSFTDYLGEMMELCFSHRAEDVGHRFLDSGTTTSTRVILTCTIPLSEIVTDFFDKLKGRSSGYASFECVVLLCPLLKEANEPLPPYSYEDAGYKASDLSKARIKICVFSVYSSMIRWSFS
jgi:hypothetical protein